MYFRYLDSAMQEMSASLAEPGDVSEVLPRIVETAADTIPGAEFASITVRENRDRLETLASTSPLVVQADELQYRLQEGPCYDTVTVDTVAIAHDLTSEPRWPRFGPDAARLGLRSQMGIRMRQEGDTSTGLNLYSVKVGAFDKNDGLPQLFASHAAVALGYVSQLQNLQRAIDSRQVIGTAIGITMERYDLTSERAFEFLIRISQNSNTKLRVVAANVVETRDLRAATKAQTAHS